jgi:hypothetical protein
MDPAHDLMLGRYDQAESGRQGGARQPSVHTQNPHRNILLLRHASFQPAPGELMTG